MIFISPFIFCFKSKKKLEKNLTQVPFQLVYNALRKRKAGAC